MAKKKEQKEDNKKGFGHNTEIIGLLLILLSIIGFGRSDFGIMGSVVSGFSIFLFGSWWVIGPILLFAYGLHMTIKKQKAEVFTKKLIGIYILLIGILVYSHLRFVVVNELDIVSTIRDTIDQLILAFRGKTDANGGGIIGAILAIIFEKLFSVTGTRVVAISFMIFGIIIFLNVSLVDSIKWLIGKIKWLKSVKKSESVDEEEDEVEVKDDSPDIKEEVENENTDVEVIEYNKAVTTSYMLPDLTQLLKSFRRNNLNENKNNVKSTVERLEKVLLDFDIHGKVVEVNIGPAVTQYEIELKSGTKLTRVRGLSSEIALALAAKDVRIQAPIPGRSTIGIELPNVVNAIVTLREVMEDIPKSMNNSKLCVALGKNIMGKTMFMEINKTPHLLVAGATGSGKSSCINSIIATILIRTRPDEVKLVLVDPKKVEMGMYNGIPHLLMPVVTDPKKASVALMKMVSEMERRYDLFSETETKNISDYNAYVDKRNKNMNGELDKLPYIVIIIDELADLMLVAAKEVEDSILRITQMARAAGIHLIVATQRPSTDVITGIVKANIPSRISFAVSSSIDSRTILDMTGAEKLLGKGDMLFLPMGENCPVRIQGSFVTDEEVKRVVDYTVSQQKASYDEKYDLSKGNATDIHNDDDEYEDPLYNEIVEFVVKNQKASASLLQRKYKLGYNRAARIVDLLEERGIVGPQNGSKPREVLVEKEEDK